MKMSIGVDLRSSAAIANRYNHRMHTSDATRRRFLNFFSGIGLGSTLLPGVLWSQAQNAPQITIDMLRTALAISGLNFSEEDQKGMLDGLNRALANYEEIRKLQIPNDVQPPFYFSPLVPGMKVNRTREPLRFSSVSIKRPANLEDVAFWPIGQLAHLIKTKQVSSVELTQMYLARLHKYNEKLNCVVTFLDETALAEAKRADAEIAAGDIKVRCMGYRGARRTSSRLRDSRQPGDRVRTKTKRSTKTRASSSCCAMPARCLSRRSLPVNSRRATAGS